MEYLGADSWLTESLPRMQTSALNPAMVRHGTLGDPNTSPELKFFTTTVTFCEIHQGE